MKEIPQPKLGDVTAITVASTDPEMSFAFYKKLGFSEVLRGDFPFEWIQISDGALLMMIRKDLKPAISLTYYVKELDRVVADLQQSGISFLITPSPEDFIKRYVFESPDGLKIALVTFVDEFRQPAGPTMLNMPQADFFNPEKYVNKVCGMYGEFAHPVKSLEESLLFWEKLGFKALSKYASPYPWAIITDGLAVVGLHQTKTFSYPVITYFAADMKSKIEKLKNAGLDNFTETGGGNITLATPESQHINLFKMGM